jgi:DNA excision repair protein ERCC-4
METKISIIADDREAGSDVVRELLARPDCQVTIRRLPTADYQIADRLLFERKTLPDLVASIADGRLFRQANRLAAGQRRGVILLEGRAKEIADSGMSREAIQGALICVSVVLGIPLLRSRDAKESAQLMIYAARQLQRVLSGALPRPGARPKSKRKIQLHILQGLPGVGPSRAERLLERYGSVEAALAAEWEDLALLPGIGEVTARKIRWAVSEPIARYDIATLA